MIKNKIVITTFLGVLLLNYFSCTKPVDFNQANTLVLEPVVESSLIFYEASAKDFFLGGSEESVAEDFIEIDFFNNSFVQDNLVKAEFVFNIENSINRGYQLHISFLDNANQLLERFTVNTSASANNNIIKTTHTEVFEGETLQRIKRSRILVFTLVMLPGEAINADTPGEISVQSKGIFSLNIN
ncbi:hypothetical protein CLV33_11251 [Jejuia pallidilutea]|uniref:Uncharacterized protein n=1 Tax=Jejuia pallidilutea TaxID=504487 RepID=A0A362X359_9FLAO|nr:hypothetical protein [Jejuia pallidilutea]PQV45707.1 hypothetical protein CLV33_11251 [Jejuia pallidilutea]